MKKLFPLWGILLCVILCAGAYAIDSPIQFRASDTETEAVVGIQQVADSQYLFLPSSADLNALTLEFQGEAMIVGETGDVSVTSGQPFSLLELFGEEEREVYPLHVTLVTGGDNTVLDLNVMHSGNIRSMYITTADPEKDRSWVEKKKSNKAKGNGMVLLRPDGSVVYDGTLKQVKGRGNSTWYNPKKPYQIKLAEETDLLETGDPKEAESTWVLLANYLDPSLLHNTVTFHLAEEFGIAFAPHSEPVDLYYDGVYLGSYELSEKTEVSDGRVDIRDLEEAIEELNPDVEDLPT